MHPFFVGYTNVILSINKTDFYLLYSIDCLIGIGIANIQAL